MTIFAARTCALASSVGPRMRLTARPRDTRWMRMAATRRGCVLNLFWAMRRRALRWSSTVTARNTPRVRLITRARSTAWILVAARSRPTASARSISRCTELSRRKASASGWAARTAEGGGTAGESSNSES